MSEKDISGTTPDTEAEVTIVAAASDIGAPDQASPPETKTPDVKKDAEPASAPENKDVKEKPVSMLDKVKDILGVNKKKDTAEPSTAETEKKDVVAGEEPAAQKPVEAKADEKPADVPKEFAKHPAWQRIIKERNTYKAEVDTYKGESEQFRKIQGFLDQSGVSGQDAAKSLQMADLVYNNPQEAYKQLTQLVGDLAIRIGVALPADLQKDVSEGLLSEDRAKELSMARMATSTAQHKVQATEEALTHTNEQYTLSERTRTFDAWVEATGKTDPDLMKKLPLMVGALTAITDVDGDAKDNAEALARLNKAYAEVTGHIRNLVPQREQKQASPRNTGSSATVKTQPSTMLEAVQNRLNKSRRA